MPERGACHGSSPLGLYPSIRVRTAPPVSVRVRVRVSVSFSVTLLLILFCMCPQRHVKDLVVNFHDRRDSERGFSRHTLQAAVSC